MTELKTLKDLTDEGYGNVWLINARELKAEAVKWVKFYVQLGIFDEQIGWIKYFFNLTEEDLE